jgi:hypothetical protein
MGPLFESAFPILHCTFAGIQCGHGRVPPQHQQFVHAEAERHEAEQRDPAFRHGERRERRKRAGSDKHSDAQELTDEDLSCRETGIRKECRQEENVDPNLDESFQWARVVWRCRTSPTMSSLSKDIDARLPDRAQHWTT